MSRSVSAVNRFFEAGVVFQQRARRAEAAQIVESALTTEQPMARTVDDCGSIWSGDGRMESNHRFYMRRAAEERTAAHRAMTAQAREWHAKLASDFAERAASHQPFLAGLTANA